MNEIEFYNECINRKLKLSPQQLQKFNDYFNLLIETNKVMNLTAITNKEEVYEKHFFDSLLFSFNENLNNKKLIDVGTGAGFPGLVLAIAYPTLDVYLLEPLSKRCNFLTKVVNELHLENVHIINQRSEDYAKMNREKFDYATARAVKRLNILLEIVMPLVKVDGYFIALKGKQGIEEINECKKAFLELDCEVSKIEEVNLITNNDYRINIFIKKIKNTNKKYPRNYSQIVKKPL